MRLNMTQQEIFDTVVNGLRKQNCQSWDEASGGCMYRGDNGAKCAVGLLLPDELYHRSMEGKSVDELPDDVRDFFGADNIQLLMDLQAAPDYGGAVWEDFSDVEDYFRGVAKDYKLTFPEAE